MLRSNILIKDIHDTFKVAHVFLWVSSFLFAVTTFENCCKRIRLLLLHVSTFDIVFFKWLPMHDFFSKFKLLVIVFSVVL